MDDNTATPPQVNGPRPAQAHFALSRDLRSVLLAFPTPNGMAELTMPSTELPTYLDALAKLLDHLRLNKIVPPLETATAKMVQTMIVGAPALQGGDFSKFTAINFNKGLSDEAFWLMPDVMALTMADGIEQKVFNGMSLDDQKKMIEQVEKNRGKHNLILPPGMRRN